MGVIVKVYATFDLLAKRSVEATDTAAERTAAVGI